MGKKKRTKKQIGRPVLPREIRKDELICFRLTEKERQILNDYCWRYDASPSMIIRDCLAILGVIPDWY